MVKHSDIVILGRGLVASLQAVALAEAGFCVTLLAPSGSATARDFPIAYALTPASKTLLNALGLWSELRKYVTPVNKITVTSGSVETGPSTARLHFDKAELVSGALAYMIEDAPFFGHITGAAQSYAEVMHCDDFVKAIMPQPSGVRLSLGSGSSIETPLVLIADGSKQELAAELGFRFNQKNYGQRAIVAKISHEKPHENNAHQFFAPNGPLAILPLAEGCSAIVWTERGECVTELMALDDAAFLERLHPLFGDFLGALTLASPRMSFPLVRITPDKLYQDRLALIGDAAHKFHPLAGQGLNVGFSDVAAMDDVLVKAVRRGEDIGGRSVLERYSRWRNADIQAIVGMTDVLSEVFSGHRPLRRAVAQFGLGLVDHAGPLRRMIMQNATGVHGELPRLLKK